MGKHGGKSVSHSENWWLVYAPPAALRCTAHYKTTGGQCRREAVAGTHVCGHHGGLIPAVQTAAAARIGNAADDMVKRLQRMLDDPDVAAREKIHIAQDLLDRAGLGAAGKLVIGVGQVDPIESLFRDLLGAPGMLGAPVAWHEPSPMAKALNRNADPQALAEGDIIDGEIVEDAPRRATAQIGATRAEPAKQKTPPHIRRAMADLI